LISSVTINEGKSADIRNEQLNRPFIYCERLNPSKVLLPFDKIYNNGEALAYSLFVDEEDEKRMSVDATTGKCENTLYNQFHDAIGGSIYNNAYMTAGYTATPCAILTSKPRSNATD